MKGCQRQGRFTHLSLRIFVKLGLRQGHDSLNHPTPGSHWQAHSTGKMDVSVTGIITIISPTNQAMTEKMLHPRNSVYSPFLHHMALVTLKGPNDKLVSSQHALKATKIPVDLSGHWLRTTSCRMKTELL